MFTQESNEMHLYWSKFETKLVWEVFFFFHFYKIIRVGGKNKNKFPEHHFYFFFPLFGKLE